MTGDTQRAARLRARGLEWAAAALFVAAMAALTLASVADKRFPFRGADEQGHFSYVAHLAHDDAFWPDLGAMPLYDLDGAPTDRLNFINHPPLFYWTALPLYDALAARHVDFKWLRAYPVALTLAGFAAIAAFGLRMRFGAFGFAMLFAGATLLDVTTLAGAFSNDQMAVLGGALACLGAARRVSSNSDGTGLALLLAGVTLCSVKLTALMLVGGFAGLCLLLAPGEKRDLKGLSALAAAGLILAVPYLILWRSYGSPAPDTAGQTQMLKDYIAEFGWDKVPRVSLAAYLADAPSLFAVQLGRSFAYVALLMAMCASALVGFLREEREARPVAATLVRAAALATAGVLCVHVAFAYRRYAAYGWLGDLYPRYYCPLLAAYGLSWTLAARRFAGRLAPAATPVGRLGP